MANQEREYVIVNPNDPVVADLWKDVIQVDSNGNPQLDEQGRIIVKRYVVRGSSGVLKSEMDSAISNLNLKAVHNTDDETISGVKTFTSSPIAPTPNETVNNTQVATTAFVKNITNNLSETLNTVANKSNAIAVTNTPSQSLESGSGEIVPNTAKLNTVDLSEIKNKYLTDLRSAFLGQIIMSPIPLSDSCLHLLDGSVLSGSGIYKQFVDFIAKLSTTNPEIFITETAWQSSVSTYGECGKFVYDNTNNTIRLPKLTSFIQATSTASELGSLTAAGVPNITGALVINGDRNLFDNEFASQGAFNLEGDGFRYWASSSSASALGVPNNLTLNASRSSAIYGNSNTVQPQSIKYYYYIVVGTVSKTPVQVDMDNIATDLNSKADTDFANVTNTAKIAIAHNAMPSHTYVNLTLGARGTAYTAPADGYFTIHADVGQNGYIHLLTTLNNSNVSILYQLIKSSYLSNHGSYIPVQKGDMLYVDYNNIGPVYEFKFVYAVGSESEQAYN